MFRSVTAAAAFLALVGLALPASAAEAVKASSAPVQAAKERQQTQVHKVQATRPATPTVAAPAETTAA